MFFEYEALIPLRSSSKVDTEGYGLRKCASYTDVRFCDSNDDHDTDHHRQCPQPMMMVTESSKQNQEEQKRILDLTKKKLRSLAYRVESSHGLRNKVLLEGALRKLVNKSRVPGLVDCNSNHNGGSCSQLMMESNTWTQLLEAESGLSALFDEVNEDDFDSEDLIGLCLKADKAANADQSNCWINCDTLKPDLMLTKIPTPPTTTARESNSSSYISSPRKRSFSGSSVYSDPGLTMPSSPSSGIKRVRTPTFSSCVDICDDIPMIADDHMIATEEALYTHLASFFKRMKTKQ